MMVEFDEVPDDQKVKGHLVTPEKWKQLQAEAEIRATEDTSDIEVPDDVEDEPVEEWPDECSRQETLW